MIYPSYFLFSLNCAMLLNPESWTPAIRMLNLSMAPLWWCHLLWILSPPFHDPGAQYQPSSPFRFALSFILLSQKGCLPALREAEIAVWAQMNPFSLLGLSCLICEVKPLDSFYSFCYLFCYLLNTYSMPGTKGTVENMSEMVPALVLTTVWCIDTLPDPRCSKNLVSRYSLGEHRCNDTRWHMHDP